MQHSSKDTRGRVSAFPPGLLFFALLFLAQLVCAAEPGKPPQREALAAVSGATWG
jgi:hypothetical protein